MVEEGDLDDKLEDKATNEVVDDVKKVAMEGVDKERKQVAMKVANTNCLDDLIDNALLLLFLLLDCRICIKRRCNSQTCCHLPHPVTSLTPSPTLPPSPLPLPLEGRGQKKFHPKNFQKKNFTQKIFKKKIHKKFFKKNFQKKLKKRIISKKNSKKNFQKKNFKKKISKKFSKKIFKKNFTKKFKKKLKKKN